MKKIFISSILIFIIVIIFLGLQFEKKDNYNLILEIDSKKSLKQSLAVLPKANNVLFKAYLKYKNGGKNIKAGYYEINGSYNIRELVSILESGKSKMFKLYRWRIIKN